ncbi:monothiol glutaredoxin-S9-like [Solanum stenotomum]|uniref:monothiol glutaredoxin-S9-like n=1 Tax=Solanum stenotomum TaxID=172797 RepID=UPI0020D05846|nr:monothiol glutaredoxin-S9-like [Solanum stenotomum]
MPRTPSHRNLFPTSSGGSSAAAPSGSSRSTSRKSPPPPPPRDQSKERLGVNLKMVEVEEVEKSAMLVKLSKIEGSEGGPWELPAVYVGGKLLGGVDKVMEAHVKGEFVPMLRAAGALWL